MKNVPASRRGKPPGQVRIIGGAWRGRRVPVVDAPGVRPTADRIRETLFNWLAPVISGTRCLDLFAGTGALGLEALSRGAEEVCFVERQPLVARAIEESLRRFGCAGGRVVTTDALRYLAGPPQRFDIAFLDPPFKDVGGAIGGDVAVSDLCTLLDAGWLAGSGRVYLELPVTEQLPALPAGWQVLREKSAGQVRFALAGTPPTPHAPGDGQGGPSPR